MVYPTVITVVQHPMSPPGHALAIVPPCAVQAFCSAVDCSAGRPE
jgi:hypothetical protein